MPTACGQRIADQTVDDEHHARSETIPEVPVAPDNVRRKLKFDYLKVKNEQAFKNLEVFTALLSHFGRPQLVVHDIIQDAVTQIQKQYRLRWAMIGLRSSSDGLYRYEVECGMRPEAWIRQKAKAYKLEDFDLDGSYKAGEISRSTRVYLEEENPLFKQDEQVVNRPILLRAKRKHEDETLEADFVDTLINGPNNDLVGWIEYSGTTNGKFPDPITIRHIEVIAAILGAALTTNRHRQSPQT